MHPGNSARSHFLKGDEVVKTGHCEYYDRSFDFFSFCNIAVGMSSGLKQSNQCRTSSSWLHKMEWEWRALQNSGIWCMVGALIFGPDERIAPNTVHYNMAKFKNSCACKNSK
jgi:hypothetical protein